MVSIVQTAAVELAARDSSPSSHLAVEMVDPCSPEWNEALNAWPDAGPFHTAEWAEILMSNYGFTPYYARVVSGDHVVALVPMMESAKPLRGKRASSLPYSDLCMPLCASNMGPKELANVLGKLAVERGWSSLELRGLAALDGQESAFVRHELNLDRPTDQLWSELSESSRRAVRRARGGGVTIRFSKKKSDFARFESLHEETRRQHGAPIQPRQFLSQLHEKMIATGEGMIAVAEQNQRVIAAAIFLRRGTQAVYKFGASDRSHLHSRPNNLMMWEAIEHLSKDGVSHLCFGRSSLGQGGLRRFKSSFGAQETPLYYSRFQPRSGWLALKGETTGLLTPLFRILPLSIGRLIGPLAYRLHS